MIIHSGATVQDKRSLLINAAFGISCTRKPREPFLIIKHVIESGVSPNFSDENEYERWYAVVNGTFSKEVLRFLSDIIKFPSGLKEEVQSQMKLAR